MCTIAAIKNASSNNRLFFKNVDQTFVCKYPEAFIEKGATYRYLKIPSNTDPATPGVLAGVNEAGVVVLGADGNCMPNYEGNGYGSLNDSLLIYEHILGHCGNIWEAMGCIIQEYQRRHTGGNGDIIILGDRKDAVALEYTPDRWGIEFQGRKPYLVRSNFFVLLDHLRPAPEENTLHTSSAIRYTDALKHLSIKGSQNTLDDVFSLVRSHYPGKNAMSICRHGGAGEYFTHASFVVELKPEGI
ncbi:hypothetical protein JXA80_10480, partial [bacterium]|nr:hypothetical protein [candidate division CSSED10-310 bacterium]